MKYFLIALMTSLPMLALSQTKEKLEYKAPAQIGVRVGIGGFATIREVAVKDPMNVKHKWRTSPWRKKGRDEWRQVRICRIHKEKQERWAFRNGDCK